MEVIKIGSKGELVSRWQLFLRGQNLYLGIVDGDFGLKTHEATVLFQKNNGLEPDGKVGNKTFGKAMLQGFSLVNSTDNDRFSPNWPPRPNFQPFSTDEQKFALWGKIEYKPAPTPELPEAIKILNGWDKENLTQVAVPQLKKQLGINKICFNKKGVPQLLKLWERWEEAGLLPLILSWEGSCSIRMVKGSNSTLSNHCFGAAMDINAHWNGLAVTPALVGQKGSVRELVPIANELGFYWGGHYNHRLDGMHFEIVKLIDV